MVLVVLLLRLVLGAHVFHCIQEDPVYPADKVGTGSEHQIHLCKSRLVLQVFHQVRVVLKKNACLFITNWIL